MLASDSLCLGDPSLSFSVVLGGFAYYQCTVLCDCFASLRIRMLYVALREHRSQWRVEGEG